MKSHRQRLLIFATIGQRFARTWIGLGIFLGITLLLGWLGDVLAGWTFYVWLAAAVAFTLAITAIVWGRTAYVHVNSQGVRIQTLIHGFTIQQDAIREITSSRLSQLFPAATLPSRFYATIEPIYRQPLVKLKVEPLPLNWFVRRFVYPRFLFAPDGDLLLLVTDWIKLSRAIDNRRRKVEEELATAPPEHDATPISQPLTPAQVYGASSSQAFARSQPLILIVSSRAERVASLPDLFKDHYRFAVSSDGIAGIQHARELEPDLILIEMPLERLSGQGLLDAIRQNQILRDTPVVVLATQSSKHELSDFLDMQIEAFMIEPTGEAILLQIANSLRRHKQLEDYTKEANRLKAQLRNQKAELARREGMLRFAPKPVARQMMAGMYPDPELAWELETLTALWVEIAHLDQLFTRIDPLQQAEFLNAYLDEMQSVASSYNGTVEGFEGGAVKVVFGVPERCEPEDQVWQAIRTAIVMRDDIERLSADWMDRLQQPLNVCISMHTGPAVIGLFGHEQLQRYMVAGTAVEALRLLQATCPTGVIQMSATSFSYGNQRIEPDAIPNFRVVELETLLTPTEG